MKQRVFLASFLNPRQQLKAQCVENLLDAEFLVGIHVPEEAKEHKIRVIRDFLAALLLHEKVVITQLSFLELLKFFGADDCLLLLNTGVLEIVNDYGFTPVLRKNSDSYEATTITDTSPTETPDQATVRSRFEQRLPTHFPGDPLRLNLVQTALEQNTHQISSLTELGKLVRTELEYDLKNGNVRESLGITSSSYANILPEDAFKILRILEVNSHLILAGELKTTAIHIEAGCQSVIAAKIPPSAPTLGSIGSISVFQEILAGKSIPDMGPLYLAKVLPLQEILKIREGLDGLMFRQWIASAHYDKDVVLKKLLEPRLSPGVLEKLLRWAVPSALKISDSIGGSLLSKGSSYLLNSFLDDWHPALFLDQSLANSINNQLEIYHSRLDREKIRARFGRIGRNDPCPCGSQKKFKKCHGANL